MHIDPELLRSIIRDELNSLLISIGQPKQPLWVPNSQACEILQIDHSTLNRWLRDGRLIDGYHCTGLRSNRLWHRDRLHEYLELRDQPLLLAKRVAQWQKQLKTA